MEKLSAFADEVADDLDEQIAALAANGVDHIELRGVGGKNVLDLTADEVREIKRRAADAGIGFSAIGSPIGKFPLSGHFDEQLEGLRKSLEYAAIIEAPYVRVFSYFIPDGGTPEAYRAQVMDWLGALVEEAEKTDIVLAHENEKGIYGDTGARCLDIHETIKSSSFAGVFDFANFVECGQKPHADCWERLKPHIAYFHVKDAERDGGIVPVGGGDGDVELILSDAFASGFDNFLTLEPHLTVAEASYGRTSPELFATAVNALRGILARVAPVV